MDIEQSGTNLRQIIEQICSQPIKPPCTIQLILDDNDPETVNNVITHDMNDVEFDIIQQAVKYLIEILQINPLDMTVEQELTLNQYVHSLGYHLDINVFDDTEGEGECETDDVKVTCQMNIKTYQEYLQSNCKLQHLKKYM